MVLRPAHEDDVVGGAFCIADELTVARRSLGSDDGVAEEELWRSDGTAGGTSMVKDIRPGPAAGAPSGLTNVGGALYFVSNFDTCIANLRAQDRDERV